MKYFLLLLLLPLTFPHSIKCHFDSIYKDHKHSQPLHPSVSSTDLPTFSRTLQSVARAPIRISLDSSNFTNVVAGVGTTPTTTSANLAFILKSMTTAQQFYQNRLKVVPMAKVFSVLFCVDFSPPSGDVTNGISNSDLHLYVQYTTDRSKSYGATGKSCNYYTGTLPDINLQVGRPIVGRIIFNTYSLTDGLALTNRLFQSITSTALHQTMHILGFDSSLYDTFLDPTTRTTYATPPLLTNSPLPHASRPATSFLTTPAVKALSRAFYACSTAPGMQLENEDGTTYSSHWQRTVAYDQLMTATQLGAHKGMSAFSWALLKDTGWYTVDDTFNETTNYGYHLGCSFFYDACYSSLTTLTKYFCNVAASTNVSFCATNFYGKALCSATLLADGCGMYGSYFNCVDPASSDDGYQSLTFEQYGTNSFCIYSTFASQPLSNSVGSRCYPYVCNTASIVFTIGIYSVTCLASEAGIVKRLTALNGQLTCPLFTDFCTNSRKVCPNWCSQNGFCMGGVCNCNAGYSGSDCNQVICTATTYYSPTSNTCVPTCPTSYFVEQYSKACAPCATQCNECRNQPQICTSCISTPSNRQYFYNGVCYSQCPSNTYLNTDTCILCDATVNCLTCSLSPTNCTSCSNGLFLSTPTSGTCGATCTGSYTITDLVNYLCVATCDNNLVFNGPTCILCPVNQFKFVSNSSCISACPPLYYGDSTNRICNLCESSCQTCVGQYAENCTSCRPQRPDKYILLNLCLSICPKGTYANDTSGACEFCTVGLNCASCAIVATAVVCKTCQSGYFLANNLCSSGCTDGFYPNAWNNSCSACSNACTTCNGPSATNCLTCPANQMFLTNVTGSYCLATCPTIGYVPAATNCAACDQTCYTCNGISSSQCASCTGAYFLSGGYCRFVCPTATYPDSSTHSCRPCNGVCTFCFGPTIDNCTSCATPKVLYNFTCTASCPNGLTVNQWNVCYQHGLTVAIALIITILL